MSPWGGGAKRGQARTKMDLQKNINWTENQLFEPKVELGNSFPTIISPFLTQAKKALWPSSWTGIKTRRKNAWGPWAAGSLAGIMVPGALKNLRKILNLPSKFGPSEFKSQNL